MNRDGQSDLFMPMLIAVTIIVTLAVLIFVGLYFAFDKIKVASLAISVVSFAATAVAAIACGISIICGAAVGGGLLIGVTGAVIFGASSSVGAEGHTVDSHLQAAADVRATSILPHLLMERPPGDSGKTNVGNAIKNFVHCRNTADNPQSCSQYTGGSLENHMDELLPRDRKYNVTIDNHLQAESDPPANPVSRHVQTYRYMIPVPGGETAPLEIAVEGGESVWWIE